MTWQPIETAPKDGTRVLIYDLDYKIEVGCFSIISNKWEPHNNDMYNLKNATHWMPLPNPPKKMRRKSVSALNQDYKQQPSNPRKCEQCGKMHDFIVEDSRTGERLREFSKCIDCVMSGCFCEPVTEQINLEQPK